MRIADVEPRAFPRVTAREAAALSRAARVLAGWPARIEVALGELGAVTVERGGVEAIAPSPAGEAGGDVVLGLSRAAGAGRVVIDCAFARRALVLALGGAATSTSGAALPRVGLAERGVVAGLVAGVLHATEAPFSVSLVSPGRGALASEGAFALALAISIGAVKGWARLELPARWLEGVASRAALGPIEVEACVELARTRLAAGELAGLAAGDAVVFDGEPRAGRGAERAVRVVVGAYAAPGRLDDDGRVTLEDALAPCPVRARGTIWDGHADEEGTMSGQAKDGAGGETTTRTVDVAAVLAAAPIEVVAELGRVVLRGDEVAGLGPGAVLALGRVGASPVSLRVAGELWAEGELVDVEGELGVRVTTVRRAR